jgi:hypothetical protein
MKTHTITNYLHEDEADWLSADFTPLNNGKVHFHVRACHPDYETVKTLDLVKAREVYKNMKEMAGSPGML